MWAVELQIKDALRGVRSGLHSVRGALAPLEQGAPAPVAPLIGGVLRPLDRIAARIELTTAHVVHDLLDARPRGAGAPPALADLAGRADGPRQFAEALYTATDLALRAMGKPAAVLSESGAARAFAAAVAEAPRPVDPFDLAARVLARPHGALFAPQPPFAAHGADPAQQRLALFAALLWMLVPRDAVDQDDALHLCVAAAGALGRRMFGLPGEVPALRALLAEYARLV